jgi:adenylosuccinate synthase
MVDPTNEPNPWQGAIRSAPVDLDGIAAAVAHDMRYAEGRVGVRGTLRVSCVDQVAGRFKIGLAGRIEEIDRRSVAEVFGSAVGLAVDGLSYGPTRADVVSLDPIVCRARA